MATEPPLVVQAVDQTGGRVFLDLDGAGLRGTIVVEDGVSHSELQEAFGVAASEAAEQLDEPGNGAGR